MLKSIMRAKPQIIRKNKGMKPKRNFAFLALALATVALIRSSLLATNAISTGERLKRNTTLVKAPTLKDVVARADLVDNEPERLWERGLTPAVVWLASYPNSGTSFTMTLVERASDLSMASNYGVEVTYKRDDSVPIYANHPEGPFWEGKSGKLGKVRPLPTTSVLTKTHCGGRCIKCGADDYVVDTSAFLTSCQRTTQRSHGETVEARIPASAVSGVVHLIRNPYHNIVARFHLERRNMIREFPKLAAMFPSNATGFARWCQYLDHKYSKADKRMFNADVLQLMNDVPCRAEFFKYTQWHNLLLESAAALGFPGERPVPMLNIHYEDYANNFNQTLVSLLDFLQLPVAETQFQSFRSLPAYADHFTDRHRVAVKALIEHVASPETWKLIRHYFVHNAISASQLL